MQLAAEWDAQVNLLHVIDDDSPPELLEGLRTRASDWIDQYGKKQGEPEPNILIKTGDPYAEVLAAADELEPDLIVLGSHRKRSLIDGFLGTTGERLLRVSSRPVLVARGEPLTPYQRVLAAVDLSENSARALLAGQQLGFLTEELTVVHVFHVFGQGKVREVGVDPGPYVEEQRARVAQEVDAFLADLDLTDAPRTVLLREGRVAREILDVAEALGPDLLVLGTRGRTGLKRFALGSVAEAVMRAAPCDVLAVPSGSDLPRRSAGGVDK